jgi:hypothetical protein
MYNMNYIDYNMIMIYKIHNIIVKVIYYCLIYKKIINHLLMYIVFHIRK